MATERTIITEAEYERMADALVIARLGRDSAYNNAENASEQKAREDEIERDVIRQLDAQYTVNDY